MANNDIVSNNAVVVASPRGQLTGQLYYGAAPPYNPESAGDSEEASNFAAYWSLLLRHKTKIMLSAFAGLILGFAVGVPMTPIFRSRTSLEVLNLNEDFMDSKQSNPVTTTDYSDEVSEEETQAELLQGDALIGRVTAKLDPESINRPKPGLAKSGWRSWFHMTEYVAPTEQDKLLGKAVASLKVRVRPRTRVLEITADSKNPQFAAEFLTTLVREFIQQSVEARLSSTDHIGAWLKQQLDEVRQNLQHSEDALQAYARTSGIIFTDNEAETNVATEKLQQLQESLSRATSDRIAKQARYQLAQKSPPQALADVLSDEGLQAIEDKINETSRNLAQLNAIYTPDFSGVKRAQAELTQMQQSFEAKRANIVQRIGNDFHQAEQNENMLNAAYLDQARDVIGQDERTVQYNILKREADSNRQLYDTMLQQMKHASITSALHASNLRIVDPAVSASVPRFPNFKLNAVIGLFLGLLTSIAVLTARERADRTLQKPGDVKLWTDLPELGTIPLASTAKKQAAYSSYNAFSSGSRDKSVKRRGLPGTDQSNPVELITHLQNPSLIAESFRSALTSILFMGEDGSRPQALVLTSTQPGDGKTTVVSNIGIALAEIRNKTLIIDADLRRPRMHKIFNVPNERGLAELLTEPLIDENTARLIRQTDIPGLHVMTSGNVVNSTAAHLLHSPNLKAFINQAKQDYDMILFDSPPMIHLTDARVIARLCDATILVVNAGRTTRDALLVAKERFQEDHTRLLGTIMNNWDPKQQKSSYYYSQYRKYTSSYLPAEEESAS